MKKLILLISYLSAVNISVAQAVFDNFDNYTSGEYLCPQSNNLWTTWDNNPGGSSDVYVTDEFSYSGNNSIKFDSRYSVVADVILPLGDIKTGKWLMSFMMRIEPDFGAYFNMLHEFSGEESNWAFQSYFSETGSGNFNVGNNYIEIDFSHTTGEWFKVDVSIDPEDNLASLSINDTPISEMAWAWCLGTASGWDSTIATINFISTAPEGEKALYYIDDVRFSQTDLTVEEVGVSVAIYPNPSSGRLMIDSEHFSGASCQIFSALGARVYENSELSNQEYVDCSKWGPGVYFLRITDQLGFIQHVKFVIE